MASVSRSKAEIRAFPNRRAFVRSARALLLVRAGRQEKEEEPQLAEEIAAGVEVDSGMGSRMEGIGTPVEAALEVAQVVVPQV